LNVEGAKDEEGKYVRADALKNEASFKWKIEYAD